MTDEAKNDQGILGNMYDHDDRNNVHVYYRLLWSFYHSYHIFRFVFNAVQIDLDISHLYCTVVA